jgi:hypothetical protein
VVVGRRAREGESHRTGGSSITDRSQAAAPGHYDISVGARNNESLGLTAYPTGTFMQRIAISVQ